jgi:glycosyltransferase involved in cell wall biosynthesis
MKYSKHIVIPNGIKNTAIMENEQFFFVPIRMLEQIEYHGDVHNLHIEEDCSFSVGGMATHNCLPLLEALACGSVVIAPRHGGQLDFLNDSNSLLVNTGEMKAPKTMQYWIAHPDAVVGDPDTKHFSELLQKVYQNPVAEKKRIGEAAAKTVAEFSWNKAAHMILDLPIPKTSARMPTKKKILYVVPYGMVGGAEHWVRETICRLDRSKYDPHVAFATGGSMALHEMFGGIATVEDLGKQGREQGLRCLLESENYSVIHFYNSFGVYSLLNDMWKNGYRCRIVETVHSELVWPDSMSKVGIRNDPVLLIASVSNTLAGKLARIGNKNVVSFPQHIDWKRFKVPRSKEILRQLGIGEDTFTVGFVGRLSPEKNLSVILQCARLMPEVSFVIVGDGPQATPLMSMSKNMGNVFFAGRRGDTEHFYAAFDILMLPSLVEGMPLVLLEAMCCGTPVIASNVGAVGEAISNGKNGFLVQNPCDVQSYVRAVRALAEPGVWEACSIGAVETARTMRDRSEHFDVNGFYDMLFTQVRQ